MSTFIVRFEAFGKAVSRAVGRGGPLVAEAAGLATRGVGVTARLAQIAVVLLVMLVVAGRAMGQSTSTESAPSGRPSAVPAATSPSELATPESELFFIADADQLVMAAQRSAVLPSGQLASETVLLSRKTAANKWGFYSQVSGRVTSMTFWRGQPAAVLAGGSWRSLYEGGSTLGLPLPAGERLVRLAGSGVSLFALSQRGDTLHLLSLQSSPVEWVDVGPVPVTPGQPLDMIAVDEGGDLAIYVATADFSANVTVYRSRSPKPPAASTRPATRATTREGPLVWTVFTKLEPAERPIAQVRLLDTSGERPGVPIVWVDPGTTSGGSAYVLVDAETPPRRFSLGPHAGEVAYSAQRVRLFHSPKLPDGKVDSRLFEQPYDTATGKPLGEPAELAVPSAGQSSIQDFLSGLAIAGLMLGMLLVWRKRGEFTPELLRVALAQPLAPRAIRISADLIDALPWVAVVIYLAWFGRLSMISGVSNFVDLFVLLVAIATVITHALVAELIFGRSIGQAIFGLQVTTLDGKKVPPGDILIRNLLKGVEMLMFALPYVSMLLSPLRQSFADSAAGTVVVWSKPPPTSGESDSPGDSGSDSPGEGR